MCVAPICGCTPKAPQKVNLSYGSNIDDKMSELTYSELLNMVNNKESFLLALRPGVEEVITCSCWKTFSFLLNNYVSTNDRIVYVANVYQIADYEENFGLIAPAHQDPGFALFKDGKLQKQYIYTTKNTPQYWQNKDALKEFIEEISNEPRLIYTDIASFESVIASSNDKEVIASFVRKSCGDCGYVLPNVLVPYTNEHKLENDIYILDIEALGYWKATMTDDEKAAYQAIKDNLKLSESTNPTYGFSTGVVPTTFVYKNNQIIDGSVFFNDSLGLEGGKVVVKESYYTQARSVNLHYLDNVEVKVLEGLEVPEGDYVAYGNYYFWSQNAANRYHSPLLRAFLDKYAK